MLEILLVDDEPATRMSVACALFDAGHAVTEAADGSEAVALANETVFDVAICDVRLPKVDGLSLFRHLRRESPSTAVILMTAYGAVADAVTALREGAFDYVTKPFDCEEFTLRVIGRIAERRALRQELEQARAELVGREAGGLIVGHSPPMARLLERLDTIAQSDAHVLVAGETGTGKELLARTLHARSARRAGPFVIANCSGVDAAALDADLFGGDDVLGHRGKIREAHGGTLLLDDVGAVPMALQSKLLRVVNEGVAEAASGEQRTAVDVRIVSSTRDDLRQRVADGLFREDLYFRLNVLDAAIPALRDRKGDLPLLLQYFLKRLTPAGKVPPGIAPRAFQALAAYTWPGNVREFAHAVERALVLAHGSEIDLEHLPPEVASHGANGGASSSGGVRPLAAAVKEFERHYLLRVLHLASGRRGRAAELLGISRKNLWEKLRQHGISSADLDTSD